MAKDKTTKELTAFQRFENLAKALIAVPRKELQEKLDKYKHKREKQKTSFPT